MYLHFAWVVIDAKCILVTRVCVSVCPWQLAACPHYCTDPDVTWGNGRKCRLVVHCWADLQSVHGLRCYDNIWRTRNVSEYMHVVGQRLVSSCVHRRRSHSTRMRLAIACGAGWRSECTVRGNDDLKKRLIGTQRVIDEAVEQWPASLRACVNAKCITWTPNISLFISA